MDFIEKLKFVFQENDIEILEFNGEKESITYKCNCCQTVYSLSHARGLLSRITLCKKCYNPFTRWNIERLKKFKFDRLFPNSEIEIIEFKSLNKGGKVKCLKCGEIENIRTFDGVFATRKDCFCKNCEKEKNKTFEHLQEELSKGFLTLLEWKGVNEKAKFKCNRCGHIFNKEVHRNFDGKICPNCHKVYNKFDFEDGKKLLMEKAGPDYQLLQFTGTNYKSLIKHKCGFCYTTRIETFEKTRGCPKCFKKYSTLEQKVANFLDEHNYPYIRQKRFSDFNKFSFDFEVFINNIPILIEVQGQQHYREVEIFEKFEIQQERDKKKRDYCLVNNLPLIEIPYWEIDNLEEFLLLKFNDYLEKEQS